MNLETAAARLRWARSQHAKYPTATEAARAFGWTVSTYLGHENGDRNLSVRAAKRYGASYRVRWEWLLDGTGQPKSERAEARIVGEIFGISEIKFYPQGQPQRTAELPPGGKPSTVALEVSGGAMRGIADDGWLVFFDDERRPPDRALLNKLCVVELASGDILLRVLQPGRRKNRFDLESSNAPTLRDQKVAWAARVTWIKPR